MVPASADQTKRQPIAKVGRYALFDILAAGGMATVHLGRIMKPAAEVRTVAIKRLHPEVAQDRAFVSMFIDEARLTQRIRHPNVVGIIDAVAVQKELFLILDYVHGEMLSTLEKSVGAAGAVIGPELSARITVDALRGLHAAHEVVGNEGQLLGVVHRDISPQNLMVTDQGDTKVLDFGIAKASGRLASTRVGEVKGKLGYMAPEQLFQSDVDRRADIYAMGVVLWEMLTMRRLYAAKDSTELIKRRLLRTPTPPPSSLVADLDPRFDAIVLRATAFEPSERFATAAEMADTIEAALDLAPRTQVATWVCTHAGPQLAARAEAISAIEASTGGPTSAPIVAEAPGHPPITAPLIARPRTGPVLRYADAEESQPSHRWMLILPLSLIIVLAGAGTVLMLLLRHHG